MCGEPVQTQLTLEGKTVVVCTCGLKKPWDYKYHYPNCPWLKEEERKYAKRHSVEA